MEAKDAVDINRKKNREFSISENSFLLSKQNKKEKRVFLTGESKVNQAVRSKLRSKKPAEPTRNIPITDSDFSA
jgi:hypothetical protein